MNHEEWQKLEAAAAQLGLGPTATFREIRAAYHRLTKLYHPDTAPEHNPENEARMYAINSAYALIRRYCENFSYPMRQPSDPAGIYDPMQWWGARADAPARDSQNR